MGQTCAGAKPIAAEKKRNKIITKDMKNHTEENVDDDRGENDSQQTHSPIIIIKKQKQKEEEIFTSFEDIRKVYEFEPNILGHGHYGTVRLASLIKNKQKMYAVKTISKQKIKKDLHLFRRELEILKKLDHPNVIKFYETYQDKKYFHLVMEYCSGGELLSRITRDKMIDEAQTVKILKKILLGVKYLHEKGICHRDIKPENFLFSSNSEDSEIKIIDFGLSVYIDEINNNNDANDVLFDNQLQTVCGTVNYLAPEVIKGSYDKRCDIWSIGVLLHTLLIGELPFFGQNNTEIFDKIQNQKLDFKGPLWKKVSKEAKDLVKRLLVVDRQNRITLDQALKHPFITKLPQKKPLGADKADQIILNMLKNNKNTAQFKKEALKILVNFLEEEEIKELRQIFRKIDTTNTGMITVEELKSALKKVGLNDSEEEINNIMRTVYVDENNRQINYSSFIAATLDEKRFFNKERLWNVFKHFDIDDTNYISIQNLKEVLARAGRNVDYQELQDIMNEVDITLNQRIDWSLFVTIMTSTGNTKTRQHIDRSISNLADLSKQINTSSGRIQDHESNKNQSEEQFQVAEAVGIGGTVTAAGAVGTSQILDQQRKSSFEQNEQEDQLKLSDEQNNNQAIKQNINSTDFNNIKLKEYEQRRISLEQKCVEQQLDEGTNEGIGSYQFNQNRGTRVNDLSKKQNTIQDVN